VITIIIWRHDETKEDDQKDCEEAAAKTIEAEKRESNIEKQKGDVWQKETINENTRNTTLPQKRSSREE
tara:strand:- start:842 stop:1048 length:207 start_codon:yes stop_codon:yes gene_type:complete